MDIETILAEGESLTIEFKSQIFDKELVKAVSCMSNSQGGTLLIGVEDDGTVCGARPRHGDATNPDRVAAVILNTTTPPLPVSVSLHHYGDHEIIRIDVPIADPGPTGTKDGVFTKRVLDTKGEPQCLPMTAHEIVSLGMVTRGQDFAAAVARGATLDDLDPDEFDRFRHRCADTGDPIAKLGDLDILRALGLEPHSAPISIGAILLFGKNHALRRWIPNAEFLFQDLRHGPSSTNDHIVGPLVKVAEELRSRIDSRNTTTEILVGLHRLEIPLIPEITRRETVANALVHRDYAELGPTRVQITDDDFIVTNPGGLPPGVTVANILEQSKPRSVLLASAFLRAGLVERKGKGVNEMFEHQLRAGRDAPDYSGTTLDSVVVSIPLGTSDLDLVRFLRTYENDNQRLLTLDELRVIHEVKASGSLSPGELASSLDLPSSAVRRITTSLLEAGIVESRGTGRSRSLHLTARFYDLAHDRSAYVRVKGADPFQLERMILDYVAAYGSITRAQAAELCQNTPPQARAILKRMVDKGALRMVGERRGAKYLLEETA
ncbi:crosslink repair DNA glycosylase YcaQ family protein [Dietzia sp. B19]|uniref:DNA glycosylase AlkZ-like family protein n=1 Tax=Dietzia sp. B19 TaxID=1630632 RepID=UPI00321F6916